MKIIITVNTYYPLKDGVQFVTQYHAENLVKRGHNVIVLTTNHGDKKEEVHNGVKIVRFNASAKYTFYKGEKGNYLKYILSQVDDTDALINICTQHPLTDWCFSILDKVKCKKILYMHGMYDKSFDFKIMTNFADFCHKLWNNVRWGIYYKKNKKIFKKYNNIIQLHKCDLAYSFFERKYNINCNIIENAVDDVFFDNEAKREKYAISVANYMPRKNQEFILKSFYNTNIDNEFGLVLIGSEKNNYYNRLINLNNKLEKKYGHKNVRIIANIDRNKTIEMIKKSYIYLLGSKWEAFPISIVEAMAAKIPFISTNVGIVKYLPGGVIVNDEKEMSNWLEIFLQNDYLRKSYGIIGNEYAQKHMMVEKKVDDLEKILKG